MRTRDLSDQNDSSRSTAFHIAVMVAVAVLGVGGSVWMFLMVSQPSDTLGGLRPKISTYWEETLLGKQIALPSSDSRDLPIPQSRPLIVLTLSCTSCGSPSRLIELLAMAAIKPVVVVSEDLSNEYRDVLISRPDLARLILTSRENRIVPDAMAENAPQAALLDENNVVVAIPRNDQLLEMFFERPDEGKKYEPTKM